MTPGNASRARLSPLAETFLRSDPDLLFAVSVPDFRVTWLNAVAADYFRRVRGVSDPLGRTAHEIAFDAERAERFVAWFTRAVAEGGFTVEYQTPGDAERWRLHVEPVFEDGVCRKVAVRGVNVTPLVHTEARLAETQGMYQSLFESMGEGAVFQALDGRIVAVNRAAEEIEGRTAQQMIGQTSESPDWGAVREDGSPFPGDEHPSMVTLRTGRPQEHVVMGIRRPDGERRWITINSRPVVMAGDATPTAVVTTFHDITQRKELEADLRTRIGQLDKALEQTLVAISEMVEMRDPYTAGHQREVARICEAIGGQLGLPQEQLRRLNLAALVHDIGKIAVPAEILSKPTRLSALEYEMVKQHAEYGHRILSNVEFAGPIAEIVWQHHERLDGSGYPRGLQAARILPEARIVAVADVVESMTSHRPYRPALGIEAALDELDKGAGVLYDADVVQALKGAIVAGFKPEASPW